MLWLVSDSVNGAICIGGIITKITQHFKINPDRLKSIPYSLFDEKFLKNSNQFKKVNNLYVWKSQKAIKEEHDQDMQDIENIGNLRLDNVDLEEEQDPSQTQEPTQMPITQRKRARASTS